VNYDLAGTIEWLMMLTVFGTGAWLIFWSICRLAGWHPLTTLAAWTGL